MLKSLDIPYPEFGVIQNADEALELSKNWIFQFL